jgi:single-strand DNA-binding protein
MADISTTQLLGRIGADPEFRTTQGGKDLAIFSLATDTGWFDKESGEWRKNLNWHRVVVFPPGLVDRARQRGKKGVRVIVDGEISYHTYRKDGEQTDRREAEIHVKGDGGLNFIDGDKAD